MGREFGKKTWRTAMDFQPLEKGLGILSELDILEKALDLSKPKGEKNGRRVFPRPSFKMSYGS
jgi:hypothetical protein